MRRTLGIVIALLATVVPAAAQQADWTILVYMGADNDLERFAVKDVNEMEKVGSTARVNVVVLLDRSPGYDQSSGNWSGTRVARIVKDSDPGRMSSFEGSNVQDLGPRNTGDPKTLRAFAADALSKYPARRTALVLWNHGGGWRDVVARGLGEEGVDAWARRGLSMLPESSDIANAREVCVDESSGGDSLYTREIREALEPLGRKMDLLGFDACLMGMIEVAYEMRSLFSVMVASQELEPGDGWAYDLFLPSLTSADKALEPREFASKIVDAYNAYYGTDPEVTLSALDLSRVAPLCGKVSAYVNSVLSNQEAQQVISAQREKLPSYHPRSRAYKDFLSLLEATPNLPEAKDLFKALQSLVITNHSGATARGRGVSIYLPAPGKARDIEAYSGKNIRFAGDTGWPRLLRSMLSNWQTAEPASADEACSGGPSPVPTPTPAPSPTPSGTEGKLLAIQSIADGQAPDGSPGSTWFSVHFTLEPSETASMVAVLTRLYSSGGDPVRGSDSIAAEDATQGQRSVQFKASAEGAALEGKFVVYAEAVVLNKDGELLAQDSRVGALEITRGFVKLGSDFKRSSPKPWTVSYRSVLKRLSVTTNPELQIVVDKTPPVYSIDDSLKIGVKSSKDGYLYLFDKSSSGRMTRLIPNRDETFRVSAGNVVYYPSRGGGNIRITGPGGREILLAVVLDHPLADEEPLPLEAISAVKEIRIMGPPEGQVFGPRAGN